MTELQRKKNQNDWTFEEKKKFFESRYSSYEMIYAEGGSDGFLYLQCRYCGSIFRRGCQCMRPSRSYEARCHSCDNLLRKHKKRLQEHKSIVIRYGDSRKYRQLGMKQCKVCEQLFVPTRAGQSYCSTTCATYLHWKGKEAYRYKINLHTLYHRDRGICHICGKPCDWTDYKINEQGYKVYGNLYPTRDHLIPKSKGGEHSYQNIALAHLICNSRRGNAI